VRDVATIWQEFLKIVREEAGSRVVETWFKAVRMCNWDARNKIVHVEAPNSFVKSWISQHYMHLFERHLSRLLNEPYIHMHITDARKDKSPSSPHKHPPDQHKDIFQPAQVPRDIASTSHSTQKQKKRKRSSPARVKGPLNSGYAFDTFVVGTSNTLAFSAAHAAAGKLGTLYNPLYIYGGSGLGKTHLLQAMGNYVRHAHKQALVLYQSADSFISEFINAIRFNRVYEFETRYKDVDMLLLDDVQCIAYKEQTQEMFSHICNTLYQMNKQVVVTSNTFPRNIQGLSERVCSRLEGGLVADIQAPSQDMKVSIIHKKAQLHDTSVSSEVAEHIASYRFANIRELEAAFMRVIAFSSLKKAPVTRELVGNVFHRHHVEEQPPLYVHTVARSVLRFFPYTISDVRSAKRNKELVRARHVAMYFMKRYTRASLYEIAAFFSRKDHTTVLHAYEKVKQARMQNAEYATFLDQIDQALIEQHHVSYPEKGYPSGT